MTTTASHAQPRWVPRLLHIAMALLGLASVGVYLLAVLFALSQGMTIPAYALEGLQALGVPPGVYASFIIGLDVLTMLVFVGMAMVIFRARARDPLALLVSISLTTLWLSSSGVVATYLHHQQNPYLAALATALRATGLGTFLLIFYLFPCGTFRPAWTRPLAYTWGMWLTAWAFLPERLNINPNTWSMPLRMLSMLVLHSNLEGTRQQIMQAYSKIHDTSLYLVMIIWFGSGILAQVMRYRSAPSASERQQTKWVMYGLTATAIGALALSMMNSHTLWRMMNSRAMLFEFIARPMANIAFMLTPLAFTIAILHYRLWEIDFLVNRALVYSALTGLLGVFYFADVVALQALFRALTGQESTIAIVASTLLIAALGRPLYAWLQRGIDRLFFREKVDFQQAITTFNRRIRSLLDLPEVLSALVNYATSLLHIQSGAVYLWEPEEEAFILRNAAGAPEHSIPLQLRLDASQKERMLEGRPLPYVLGKPFMLMVPLVAPTQEGDSLVGILTLGPRKSGHGYSRDDRSLLAGLADQAGTAIHVAQLIHEKASEAQRRLEAEQRLEAYRNSPAGKAEQLAQHLLAEPEAAFAAVYSLAGAAASEPEKAATLKALPQALEGQETPLALQKLAQGFEYLFESRTTPALVQPALKSILAYLKDTACPWEHAATSCQVYETALRALRAESLQDLRALGVEIRNMQAKLPALPAPFDALPAALKHLHHVTHALQAAERVDTSRDKLAYLAAAVEALRRTEHFARTQLNSADRPLVEAITEHWLGIVTRAISELQTSARLHLQLLTRNTWQNEVITLALNVRNSGRGAALNIRITLMPDPAYTLLDEQAIIPRLSPGEEQQVHIRLRPRLEEGYRDLRARFTVLYTDPRGADQAENFADIVHLMEATQEFQFIPNPYVVGTPLQTGSSMFFGREDVIAFIQQNVQASHHNNLVLIGQRRTGKTSLLKQLPARLGDSYLTVYVDGQSLGLDPGLENFYLNLATEIAFAVEDAGLEIPIPEPEDFQGNPAATFERVFLPQVMRRIQGRHLLLLLDEFEELEGAVRRGTLDASIFGFLRHLIQHTENLSVIFCGTHRIEELASDYWNVLFNISLYRHIGFLQREEAMRLIQEPVGAYGMRYDDLALDKIWRVTAGHPYFLQLLCHSLVNLHNQQERNYLTVSDVNTALDDILASGEAHFVYLWNESTPVERLVLAALSRMIPITGHATLVQLNDYLEARGISLARTRLQEALNSLVRRDVLTLHEENEPGMDDGYHWKLGLLALWAEKYKSINRVIEGTIISTKGTS